MQEIGLYGAQYRKRLKRYDTPGDAHFLTFHCFRSQDFLKNDQFCAWLADALRSGCERHQISLLGYMFMPNHVHLLVHPNQRSYSTAKFVQAVKLSTTNKVKVSMQAAPAADVESYLDIQPNGDVHFRFWQRGGGYDKNIRDAIAMKNILEYMHNNPVRRGLCDSAADWKWSSAGAYSGQNDMPLKVDLDVS